MEKSRIADGVRSVEMCILASKEGIQFEELSDQQSSRKRSVISVV